MGQVGGFLDRYTFWPDSDSVDAKPSIGVAGVDGGSERRRGVFDHVLPGFVGIDEFGFFLARGE